MKLYTIIKPDFEHHDDRGFLLQLVHDKFSQFNIIFTKKGSARGKHYHKTSLEAFYVISGSVEVTFELNDIVDVVRFKKGDFFSIPPLVKHGMLFLSDCLMAQLYDVPVENNGVKDIYTQ